MGKFWKKYRVLLGIELLVTVLLFFGCFMKEEELIISENPELWGYGTEERTGFYQSDSFELKSGVYRLVARAKDLISDEVMVGMRGETNLYNAIRCNDVPFVAGEDYLEFEVYVVERMEEASLVMLSKEQEPAVLQEVSLYSTNLGNRIILFNFIAGVLVLNGLLILRSRILKGQISGEKLVSWSLLAGSFTVAGIPLMVDYFIGGGDTATKLIQIEVLTEALAGTGEWPEGSIQFLGAALLRVIGFHLMTAYKAYLWMVIFLMGTIVFLVLRKLSGDVVSAAVGSMVYTLASDRLYRLYDISGNYSNDLVYALFVMTGSLAVTYVVRECRRRGCISYKYSAITVGIVLFLLGRGTYKMNRLIYNAEPIRVYNIEKLGKVSLSMEVPPGFEEGTMLLLWMILLVVTVGGKWILWKRKSK